MIMIDPEDIELIKENIFQGAHSAITDWSSFDWHRGANKKIDTYKKLGIDAHR